ncbi:MAG: ATP-dependent metalloprotease, partial [Candidatus Hydrothermota bacterium]
ELGLKRVCSEEIARLIDEEISRIVREAEAKAREILTKNIDKLHALAEALLQKETLDKDEIDEILGFRKKEEKAAGPVSLSEDKAES